MIPAFISENQEDWDENIYLLMLAYRSSVHESTKVTPNEMVFGRQVTLPIELIYGKPTADTEIPDSCEEYAYQLQQTLDKIHEFPKKKKKTPSNVFRQHETSLR